MRFTARNFPNPFGTTTRIAYALSREKGGALVSLAVYDPAGRLVRTVVDAHRSPGKRIATWDGSDETGAQVAAGVYLCRLSWNGQRKTLRLILLR